MNITPEIVKNLLNTLVTPEYDEIVDYDVILRQNPEGKVVVGIDILLKQHDNLISDVEMSIERKVRNVMKYLSPSFTMVEFHTTNNY